MSLSTAHEPFEQGLTQLADHAPGSVAPGAAVHHSLREGVSAKLEAWSGLAKTLSVREGLGNNVAITRGENPRASLKSCSILLHRCIV